MIQPRLGANANATRANALRIAPLQSETERPQRSATAPVGTSAKTTSSQNGASRMAISREREVAPDDQEGDTDWEPEWEVGQEGEEVELAQVAFIAAPLNGSQSRGGSRASH